MVSPFFLQQAGQTGSSLENGLAGLPFGEGKTAVPKHQQLPA